MGYLHNPKHEKYAQELVDLLLVGSERAAARLKAHERAGFVPGVDNARKVANRKDVKERVKELMEAACKAKGVTRDVLVARIDDGACANAVDLFEDDGKTFKNLKTLPRELQQAIQKIKLTEDGRMEVELVDKNQANFTLLKHFGGLPEPEGPRTQVNVFSALPLDDQAALADLIDALPGRAEDPERAPAGERGAG